MADKPLNISTGFGGSALVPQPMMSSPMVTLPSIPNPAPPPPQKVAVVTPGLAQKDLAGKQTVANGVAQALQQQTQGQLNTFGQPISQAGGSPVPTAQPQQGQAPAAPQTQQGQNPQAQTQTAQQPTQPVQGQTQTTAQPGQTTAAPAGTSQVTLPNGTTANYNASTGALTTTDGRQLTYKNGQWVDSTTGLPPTVAVGNANQQMQIPSTGDPVQDYVIGQLQQNQASMDLASATHQQQVQQILNGTFPLTADQQAQVASLQNQFSRLRKAQEDANSNYEKSVQLLGIRSGRYQYQPGIFNEDINDAVNAGIEKIADLDIQAAGAVATLKQGFLDNDYKIINESYKDLQDAIESKNNTLTQIQTAVKTAVDTQTARLNQQKAELDIQKTNIDNLAQSALSATLQADGTLDLDMLQQIADEQGVDPNALYSAVQQKQKDEIVFQQAETKFASDQLQAAAQLEATKASTSVSYANAAKLRAEADAAQPSSGDFAATVDLAAATGSSVYAQKAIKANLQKSIAAGDYKSAYAQITQAAANALGGTEGTNFEQRQIQLSVLDDLQSAIQAYADAGGKTNILKGKQDDIQNKIGALITDPQYGALATQLDAAFQAYRQYMTGAAFGAQESAEYASVLPNKGNTLDLNSAKITGMRNYLNSTVEGGIKAAGLGEGAINIKNLANRTVVAPDGEEVIITD